MLETTRKQTRFSVPVNTTTDTRVVADEVEKSPSLSSFSGISNFNSLSSRKKSFSTCFSIPEFGEIEGLEEEDEHCSTFEDDNDTYGYEKNGNTSLVDDLVKSTEELMFTLENTDKTQGTPIRRTICVMNPIPEPHYGSLCKSPFEVTAKLSTENRKESPQGLSLISKKSLSDTYFNLRKSLNSHSLEDFSKECDASNEETISSSLKGSSSVFSPTFKKKPSIESRFDAYSPRPLKRSVNRSDFNKFSRLRSPVL